MDLVAPGAIAHAWQVMHPPVQPHDQGWLDVGDGHAVYWEQCGHPGAPAALFVHGGPGAGVTAQDRRWFDPRRWRTVLYDQRGCGRSRAGSDVLHANTTAHLVHDMESLRRHLAIERWLLVGGSWGSTLALAYAQAHPERVQGLVLRGVFLGTTAESDWLYTPDGAARTRPQAWRRLCTALDLQSGQLLLDVMQTRLHANQTAATTAALAWWRWEQDLMAAEAAGPDAAPPPDDHRALEMARIGVHYARARWFLPDSGLLAQTSRLHHLPCVIVQGGRDLVTPAAAARALHATWPGAQLHEVPQAGHASTQPDMAAALVQAIENADPNNPHHQEPRHGPLQAH